MGYTHYWEGTPNLTPEVIAHAKRIIAKTRRDGVMIKGPLGEGRVQINAKGFKFNGDESTGEAHESVWIEPKHTDFNFCKTARKPYDAAVVAILTLLRESSGGRFDWSSDGDVEPGAHDDGLTLYGETIR